MAGTDVAAEVFKRVDPSAQVQILHRDGEEIPAGETIMEVRGSARGLLTAERVDK